MLIRDLDPTQYPKGLVQNACGMMLDPAGLFPYIYIAKKKCIYGRDTNRL